MTTAKPAAPATASLIHEKGGTLYVWIDGAGIEHVHFHPPHDREESLDWNEFDPDGVGVFTDPKIDPPEKRVIVLHQLPYRHLQVLWNGEMLDAKRGGC